MQILLFIALVLVGMFAVGTFLGATYVPTRKGAARQALRLLDLKPGDTLLDLGSGSGDVLLEAAKQGIKSVGYEINPALYWFSKLRTKKFKDLIDIKLADFWHQDWPHADGIYVFLTTRFMSKLDEKIKEEVSGPTTVVSYAYEIPGQMPKKKTLGLYLYHYR